MKIRNRTEYLIELMVLKNDANESIEFAFVSEFHFRR